MFQARTLMKRAWLNGSGGTFFHSVLTGKGSGSKLYSKKPLLITLYWTFLIFIPSIREKKCIYPGQSLLSLFSVCRTSWPFWRTFPYLPQTQIHCHLSEVLLFLFFPLPKILIKKKFYSLLAHCSEEDCLLPGSFLSFHPAPFGALCVYLDLALICSFLRLPGWNICCQAQPWWKSPRSLDAQQPQCCCWAVIPPRCPRWL